MHPISYYNVSLDKFAIGTSVPDFNKEFAIVSSSGGASMGFGCLGFIIFGLLWFSVGAGSMVSKTIHLSTVVGLISVFFIVFMIYQYFAQSIRSSMRSDDLRNELQKLVERVKENAV